MSSNTQQRRMFRGRGGPNDRRLPKHNARRRNTKQASQPDFIKYEEQDALKNAANEHSPMNEEEDMTMSQGESSSNEEESTIQEQVGEEVRDNEESAQCRREMIHLRKRVKNVQESIQLSSKSISNPTTYRQNVLNAVANSVNEWRSIVSHYSIRPFAEDDEESQPDTAIMDPDETKATSLAVFMLIQLSLQSGPLAGSKPGYLKRCGSEVAKVVWTFLDTIAEMVDQLLFTTKQVNSLKTWQSNAQKAAENDKAPSKSALKRQQQAQTKKKKGNKK